MVEEAVGALTNLALGSSAGMHKINEPGAASLLTPLLYHPSDSLAEKVAGLLQVLAYRDGSLNQLD